MDNLPKRLKKVIDALDDNELKLFYINLYFAAADFLDDHEEFIVNFSDNELSGSAHFWLGKIYLFESNYRQAALVFGEGVQKFPKSIKAPDMLYKLSESLIIIDKKQDSCNTLKKLKEEFPQHKLVSKVESMIKSLECNFSVE